MIDGVGANLVLIDTSIWIHFLRPRESPHRRHLDLLLAGGTAATTGLVLVEVLHGSLDRREYDRLARLMDKLPFLDTTGPVWRTTAQLSFSLKSQGGELGLPDLVIAAVALEHGCRLYTTDRGFRRVPDLRLYDPGAELRAGR